MDVLSRHLDHVTLDYIAIFYSMLLDLDQVNYEVNSDIELSQILKDIWDESNSRPYYYLWQGTLMNRGQIVLPNNSELIHAILHKLHNSSMGGHSWYLRRTKECHKIWYRRVWKQLSKNMWPIVMFIKKQIKKFKIDQPFSAHTNFKSSLGRHHFISWKAYDY